MFQNKTFVRFHSIQSINANKLSWLFCKNSIILVKKKLYRLFLNKSCLNENKTMYTFLVQKVFSKFFHYSQWVFEITPTYFFLTLTEFNVWKRMIDLFRNIQLRFCSKNVNDSFISTYVDNFCCPPFMFFAVRIFLTVYWIHSKYT